MLASLSIIIHPPSTFNLRFKNHFESRGKLFLLKRLARRSALVEGEVKRNEKSALIMLRVFQTEETRQGNKHSINIHQPRATQAAALPLFIILYNDVETRSQTTCSYFSFLSLSPPLRFHGFLKMWAFFPAWTQTYNAVYFNFISQPVNWWRLNFQGLNTNKF